MRACFAIERRERNERRGEVHISIVLVNAFFFLEGGGGAVVEKESGRHLLLRILHFLEGFKYEKRRRGRRNGIRNTFSQFLSSSHLWEKGVYATQGNTCLGRDRAIKRALKTEEGNERESNFIQKAKHKTRWKFKYWLVWRRTTKSDKNKRREKTHHLFLVVLKTRSDPTDENKVYKDKS